jgi:Ca2+-binding EF-hand superfamily protein
MCCNQQANRKDSYTFSDALRDVAEQMQVTDQELLKLFQHFKKFDRSGKRKLCADDVFDSLGLDRSYFLDRLFISVDRDNDGMWSFAEWLTALAIFNLYTHEKLMNFIFKIFDDDDSGYIDGVNYKFLIV